MNDAAVALAYKHCERITRSRARNFYYGIALLPPRKRSAMCALYAMARRIDDVGDSLVLQPLRSDPDGRAHPAGRQGDGAGRGPGIAGVAVEGAQRVACRRRWPPATRYWRLWPTRLS